MAGVRRPAMTKRRMTFLAGGLCAGLALTAATARAGGVNMDKINRGAWLIPTMPGQAHGAKVASPGRRSPRRTSTLELQLGPAGQPATSRPALGARPPLVQATAGQPLRLQLRITHHGPAAAVPLPAFTSAFTVRLPPLRPPARTSPATARPGAPGGVRLGTTAAPSPTTAKCRLCGAR